MSKRLNAIPALLMHMLLLLVLPLPLMAQDADDGQAVIEIVRLQHRSADSIREAIQPLLDRRGSIGQLDNNLIIATTRGNLRELQALIEQLDLPRRTLRVSVDFDYRPGTADLDTATVAPAPPLSVNVLEGETAVLSEQRTADAVVLDGDTAAVAEQAADGSEIHVRAELRGEQVEVELDAFIRQDDAPGSLTRTASTTLSMSPGQWQIINPLAALLPDPAQDGNSNTISTSDAEVPAATGNGALATATATGVARIMAVRVDIVQ